MQMCSYEKSGKYLKMIASNQSAQVLYLIYPSIILLVHLDVWNVSWCDDFKIYVVTSESYFIHFFTQITIADRQP